MEPLVEIHKEEKQVTIDTGKTYLVLSFEEARKISHEIIHQITKVNNEKMREEFEYNGSSL